MATTDYGIYILLPPRFEAEIDTPTANFHSLAPPPPHSLVFRFLFPSEFIMPSSCAIPPVNVHFPGSNTAISDIPVGSSTSPSSLVADDEQLTVRPLFAAPCPFAYLCPPKSEPFIILMTVDRSRCVLPCCDRLRRRSVYLPLALVRNREQTDVLSGAGLQHRGSRPHS